MDKALMDNYTEILRGGGVAARGGAPPSAGEREARTPSLYL